jgi:hypothetical protein
VVCATRVEVVESRWVFALLGVRPFGLPKYESAYGSAALSAPVCGVLMFVLDECG